MTFEVEGHRIGAGERTFVIAEIGVNHDGSVGRAGELVGHAARAGADAVKLQVFRAKALMHASSAFAGYQEERCEEATPTEMLERYELTREELARVVGEIRRCGMVPLATPFSLEDVGIVAELGLPAVKIASPDLVNEPLLRRCTALGRPMLVSTGAATMGEVEEAVGWLRGWGVPFAVLHCVSSYPAAVEDAHLSWIGELMRFGAPVGYSDHTTEELAGALAVAAGAVIVEKHLTYDRAARGPDHAASADPSQFTRYVGAVRVAERMCGAGGKRVLEVEEDVRRVSRQSVVLRRAVKAGEAIKDEDLTVQRPGDGIPAARLRQVVGRVVRSVVPAGTMLREEMLVGGNAGSRASAVGLETGDGQLDHGDRAILAPGDVGVR